MDENQNAHHVFRDGNEGSKVQDEYVDVLWSSGHYITYFYAHVVSSINKTRTRIIRGRSDQVT